jgi:hypothetical protein
MTDHDEAQHRSHFEASGDAVDVRAGEDDGDGLFRVRMPVSSTAEARDGDSFTRDRLRGFRDQIDAGDIGVFLDHGRNESTGSRYSALGKVGYWDSPEVADRDAGADLVADAVLMDPAELDASVGDVREALATLKAQAELGVPLASSVGWSEDTGDRDEPGGADLLEISIVGIPSDPRTTTASAEAAPLARAVSAASSDFDVSTFVRELAAGDRNTVEVGGEEIDLTPPDAVQNAATVALAKDDELDPDCGTGAGRQSAQQIAGGDVTADRIDDIAAYLTSHEEDVTADGPPSDWSDEEWEDCGNLQYALWGGTGTGTGLEWAQSRANQVADAQGEELPYPDRGRRVRVPVPDEYDHDDMMEAKAQAEEMGVDGGAIHAHGEGESRSFMPGASHVSIVSHLRQTGEIDMDTQSHSNRNLDDPEFSEGDAVMWSSQDTPVHGRVADIGDEFEPAEGVTITGDEGEAVYLIHEYDDSLEDPQFRRENVAKPESSLSESTMDMPPASDDNFADSENSMSDDTTESGEQSDDTTRDELALREMEEKMDEMREMMEENTRMTKAMYEDRMGGDGDGDDEGDEENAADTEEQSESDDRTLIVDGEERSADEVEAMVADLRDDAADADADEAQTTDRAASDDDSETAGFGLAAHMED